MRYWWLLIPAITLIYSCDNGSDQEEPVTTDTLNYDDFYGRYQAKVWQDALAQDTSKAAEVARDLDSRTILDMDFWDDDTAKIIILLDSTLLDDRMAPYRIESDSLYLYFNEDPFVFKMVKTDIGYNLVSWELTYKMRRMADEEYNRIPDFPENDTSAGME